MNRKRLGASLTELLVASVILGIGVMGVFSLWNYVLEIVNGQRIISAAGQIARADMEELKVRGFDNLPKGAITGDTTATWQGSPAYYTAIGNRQNVTVPDADSFFSVTRRIDDTLVIPDINNASYVLGPLSTRTVTVTVRRLRDNEVLTTMTTLVTKGGV